MYRRSEKVEVPMHFVAPHCLRCGSKNLMTKSQQDKNGRYFGVHVCGDCGNKQNPPRMVIVK